MLFYLILTSLLYGGAAFEFFKEKPRTKEVIIRGLVALAMAAYGFFHCFKLI